jgi:dihydroorotase
LIFLKFADNAFTKAEAELKGLPLPAAAFGVIGLETALGLALTQLVHTGKISLARLVMLMSTNPARIINQPHGRLRVGNTADLTLFDPNLEWTYRAAAGRSKSRNSPFDGWQLKGAATATIVAGKISEESVAAGFKHASILVIIAVLAAKIIPMFVKI